MFTITKRIEIAGAHKLNLPYESPCNRLHGHNWIVEVELSSKTLDSNGMVVDFKWLKKVMVNRIKALYDHQYINDIISTSNPTAETMAILICSMMEEEVKVINKEKQTEIYNEQVKGKPVQPTQKIWVTRISVQESEGNVACYIP